MPQKTKRTPAKGSSGIPASNLSVTVSDPEHTPPTYSAEHRSGLPEYVTRLARLSTLRNCRYADKYRVPTCVEYSTDKSTLEFVGVRRAYGSSTRKLDSPITNRVNGTPDARLKAPDTLSAGVKRLEMSTSTLWRTSAGEGKLNSEVLRRESVNE